MEAILAATATAAELLQLRDHIGTLERGKRADLIVVEGVPLLDIGSRCDAARVTHVEQSGRIAKAPSDAVGALAGAA